MTDATMDAASWLRAFAQRLGVDVPSDVDIEELLSLAGTAAHASERKAAPIACFLVALSGRTPSDAHELARSITSAAG